MRRTSWLRQDEVTLFERAGSEMVAENTGGSSVRHNDLLGGLDEIAAECPRPITLLGYQPEKAPDGNWAEKLRSEGIALAFRLKVRTRRGYQATPPPALALPPPVKVKKDRTTRRGKSPSGRWIWRS